MVLLVASYHQNCLSTSLTLGFHIRALTSTFNYQKCRFLYLVGQLGPGGLERQLHLLLKGMDRKRYLPAVVVWSFSEDDTYVPQIRALAVPLYPLLRSMSPVAKLMAFRRLVMQLKPQVVHSYSFYTNFPAWWGTLGTNAIAIGAVRSDFDWAKNGTGPLLGSLSARWPRSQIFNSFAAADYARNSRSVFAPRDCFVVRNGIDLDQFPNIPPPAGERPLILGVGSLFPVKRWDRILVAALELKRGGFDFLVKIVGDGPLRGRLEQQAQELGVADRVELLGHRDDIPDLLAGATFLVHASDSEGCPNVVMEAMACGRAVVATDVGDVPRLVDDGKTGFVVRPGDEATLVERMVTLITNRELCERMGEAGRAKAEREFGLSRLVSETLAAYQVAGWRA